MFCALSLLLPKVNCHLKECDSKRQRGLMRLPSSGSRSNTPSMFFRRESDFDDYDAKVFMPATKCERRWVTLCHQWVMLCHQWVTPCLVISTYKMSCDVLAPSLYNAPYTYVCMYVAPSQQSSSIFLASFHCHMNSHACTSTR